MTKLFIGNLSFQTDETELSGWLTAKHVEFDSIIIPREETTRRSKGVAFVTLGGNADPKKVIDLLNGSTLAGRDLRVEVARERERSNRR